MWYNIKIYHKLFIYIRDSYNYNSIQSRFITSLENLQKINLYSSIFSLILNTDK